MKKIIFIIILCLKISNAQSIETRILYNIENEIITNIDVKNEFKYLVALNNSLSTEIKFDNFSTEFLYEEEQGLIGTKHVLENNTKYTFNDSNSLEFRTRRNKEINLTEYYDLIYEYKNDCLTAGIRYKKKYYNDNDLVPVEELFFSITIVPFATFSPDQMTLNKDRVN